MSMPGPSNQPPRQIPMGFHSGLPPPTLNQTTQEHPILIWMLSLNREYTLEEYDACYSLLKDHFPHVQLGAFTPGDADSFRHIITQLLPILMMRHRRIPKANWRDRVTPNGKHWIEQMPEGMQPGRFLASMIGYHIQKQKYVVNLGLGIQLIALPSRCRSLVNYLDSLKIEINLIPRDQGIETALRRISIILALKEAYVHAIGLSRGFNYQRLEFDVPAGKALCDGHPLQGWEFRLWNAKLGVARGDTIVEELYVCVSAFFRSTQESTFIWNDERRNLQTWVQFVDIDQMIKVLPKLAV
ncbi:hypothetical protein BDZ89DRAFT_1218766 [Hymenopellis radicata]|nr:hypothetical protein BDZ89DRAFT_1218766 [Hymenopellis radicata]